MLNEKKNDKLMVALFTAMAYAAPLIALADPGLKTDWIFKQLSLVVLVVTVGLAILFYVQKATAKMITTIVVGAFLYILAVSPAGVMSGLGNFLKGLLGLG